MVPSVETRWFIRGGVPKEALNWIQRWELGPHEPEKREDHYLSFPGIASIGVKLRDGRFEVKRRDLDLGLAALGSRVTGRLAFWRKWSFKIVDDGSDKSPDSHWITIEKTRFSRKYSDENSGLVPVDPKSFPARGCTVELAVLRVQGAEWWSVGFEAFGSEDNELRNTLVLVAEKCFNRGTHPTLDGRDSFDYPEWLASLSE